MKTKILIVGHGSRGPGGNEEIRRFSEEWAKANSQWPVELCYIEFAEVLLEQGLDRASWEADRVVVLPLILNAAGHVKMEIPHHLEAARKRHPQVEFIYARHLGATEEILTVVLRQLKKAMEALSLPDPKTTGVILLGRGSSDKVANGELAKMARWLWEKSEHELVEIAFTGITYPRLETVVQRMSLLGMTQVVILPYYLYNGRLIERIGEQVARLKGQYAGLAFSLGDYFGFEPEIFQLVRQRVEEALEEQRPKMMECDGCDYRKANQDDHHHHHHHHH